VEFYFPAEWQREFRPALTFVIKRKRIKVVLKP
jgi:hypothetical protein